ncbi:hypothetical protein FRACYDRAFT_233555 [Fragilariopsis cylindrus CCMP1102]|uniref:Sulfotransferase domain-containing protein n=1 Tax=Fragilariopsis cylindrus CCMP1102 TaxID=635003 RepID=A0A1E7FZY4_9STRA|nr:hypothetical protein FRACYDRAFT_233555 [Fragilariopsis cylindrus CCMP1102]|eukprot:OEU23383.1 hypothetical protein FRACYDRAFT_233555 [Fragilariopsis cylindrus CCMP1102]
MWNHTTNTIQIPDNYKYPFGRTVDDTTKERRKKTSLEILENVLHKKENQQENRQVNDYITNIMMDSSTNPNNKLKKDLLLPIPNCFKPNTKQTRKIANELLDGSNTRRSSLSYPLFNVGFPKVGSTALNDYLNCIGIKSSHKQLKISKIMNRTKSQQPLFVQRGIQHDPIAIMQLDYNLRNGFFPQIQLLDELHEEYPNSTFILNFRPIQDWIRSTTNWYQMKYRFGLMTNIPGLIMSDEQRIQNNIERDRYYTQLEQEEEEHPQLNNRQRQEKRQEKRAKGRKRKEMNSNNIRTRRLQQLEGINEKKDDHYNNNSTNNQYIPLSNIQMARWWCNHIQHIRDYTSSNHYSSHILIELDLYNTTETSQLLYDLFVSPRNVNNNNKDYHSCWGHKNINRNNKRIINDKE